MKVIFPSFLPVSILPTPGLRCFPMPYREDNVSFPTSSSRASFDLYCPFSRREDHFSFPT